MRFSIAILLLLSPLPAAANEALLKQHCLKCHSATEPEGEFRIDALKPVAANLEFWLSALERVRAGEMPPEDEVQLSKIERGKLVAYLSKTLHRLSEQRKQSQTLAGNGTRIRPRRMNNREFSNSVRDVLQIEDIGTHQPTDNLIGDALHHGFDTHAETLGFSKFHLEEFLKSARAIVDATILSGEKPEAKRYPIRARQIFEARQSQNTKRPERAGKVDGFDFLDPKSFAYMKPFRLTPTTGWYEVKIRCIAKDRGRYDEEDTGIYDGDPIQLAVHMGDRKRVFDLPDEQVEELTLREWLAAGTRLKLHHPTDGLRLQGNGNFKFQNRITALYMKKYEPKRYKQLVPTFKQPKNRRPRKPDAWQNWVNYWMGPRPKIISAEIEGPFYDAWPPKRQVALIGENPSVDDAQAILSPIAERAWRRPVRQGELDGIVALVRDREAELGDVEAIKEGIVSILVSPQFLLLNSEDAKPDRRFMSKYSFFIRSTIPSPELKGSAQGQLGTFDGIRKAVQHDVEQGMAEPFLKAFPFAWLELNDINFMAPDPDYYKHYHRKLVSDDMIDEVLCFFQHAVKENIPVPELLTANYSFINADLAEVYGVADVPRDSQLRKYEFKDGTRGGLLGMGAFLTSTADSLSTSPIHRAVYVMENFLGIHPKPPPADVEITEPDVRQAKTIKEILKQHRSDETCASCHRTIDPYGYAFENFGPDGSWRSVYSNADSEPAGKKKRRRKKDEGIPVDPSAKFTNGTKYSNVQEYREIFRQGVYRDRFVRCFITKLLTYANGVAPTPADFAEIDEILSVSAQHEYRIVETIAAVVDSPLFRETSGKE